MALWYGSPRILMQRVMLCVDEIVDTLSLLLGP